MKLNAVGVISTNITKTIAFYEVLGFKFPELNGDEQHVEAITNAGSARLMIDLKDMMVEVLGREPILGIDTSGFAIEYDSTTEIDKVVEKIQQNGFTIVKQPWNAPWGQRYAIVADPDGYKVDLYAAL